MKPVTLWNILLSATFFILISSCAGQHTPGISPVPGRENSSAVLGDTVTEITDSILVIYQDRNNNYWFGSNGRGVYRYDGHALVQFTTKHGLCHNQLRQIAEDKEGSMYFNTTQGISKFDGTTFTTLVPVESDATTAWKSGLDDLWFVCGQDDNGPYRYDGKTLYHEKFPKHHLEDEFYARMGRVPYNPYQVYTVYRDSRNHIWFGTSTFGLCRFDGQSLAWMYEKELTHIGENGSFGIRSILEDRYGKFWICNTNHRYDMYPGDTIHNEQDERGNHLIRYSRDIGIPDSEIHDEDNPIYYMSMAEDATGNLWMVTYGNGVWRYDGKTLAHHVIEKEGKPVTLFAIYEDRQGNLWLGTHDDGVYKFNGRDFEKYRF